MLYLSTRNKTDSFTAYRAMHNDATPDGGLFVPFRLTPMSAEEIANMQSMTFGEAVAKILNLFFSEQLTGWDVDFCIGRTPVKLQNIGHKTVVAELWHNHCETYQTVRNTLYSRIYSTSQAPSVWASVAIDVAVLFGVYTQLTEPETFDISVSEDNRSMITAAWYARKLGLPVGIILLTCTEQSGGWDFVRQGQIRAGDFSAVAEHIIFDLYGFEATASCISAWNEKKTFTIDEESLPQITRQLHAVVVGADRAENVVKSIQRSNGYHIDRNAAAAFGGLQDFRSQGGEGKLTLLLSEMKPE